MTQESTPRVVEEPSTHKKKMQAYLGMAVGVVFFILLGMVVLNVWNKSQERREPKDDPVATTEPALSADRQAQFNELAKNRTGRVIGTEDGATNATNLNTEFDKIGNGMPPARDRRRGADERQASQGGEPDESPESKAVRQWKAKEELRALGAANKPWKLTAVGKGGQGGGMGVPSAPAPMMAAQGTPANIQDQIAHMNRPLDENASLEERRAEVKRRIAEAQRLRLSLQQNGAAGLPEAAGRPVADSASPMPTLNVPAAPQQSRAPANVVGYPKKNKYDADSEGKIKVPPGTEILTTLMKKGISDYTGTSLKAIANRDVYDITRQYVIFPKGTEFNIKMVRTRNVNEAISNRVGFLVKEGVLPNGNSIDFSTASVGDREGVGAIEDQTDYHLIPQFLGVAAYALIGSRTSRTGTGEDEGSYAGDVGENSRSQFAPLAEKYLNIVPTQTIRPGQSFQIVTEQEMYVEPYKDIYAKYVN